MLPVLFPCAGLWLLPGLGATGCMPLAFCDAPACWLCAEVLGFLLACIASGTHASARAAVLLPAFCMSGNLLLVLELPASFAEVFFPPPGRCAGAGAVQLSSELCLALEGARRCLDEVEQTGWLEDGRAGANQEEISTSSPSDS